MVLSQISLPYLCSEQLLAHAGAKTSSLSLFYNHLLTHSCQFLSTGPRRETSRDIQTY